MKLIMHIKTRLTPALIESWVCSIIKGIAAATTVDYYKITYIMSRLYVTKNPDIICLFHGSWNIKKQEQLSRSGAGHNKKSIFICI